MGRHFARWLGLAAAVALCSWLVHSFLLPLRPRLSRRTSKGWGSLAFDAYASAWYRPSTRLPRQSPAQHMAFQSLSPVSGVGNEVFTGDIDADGRTEIVCTEAEGEGLLAYQPTVKERLALVARRELPAGCRLHGIANVDGDPADEILASWREGKGLRLAFLRLAHRRLSVVGSVHLAPRVLVPIPSGRVTFVEASRLRVVDIDGDKRPEVLVGWDLMLEGSDNGRTVRRRDRRIAIHDLRTGEERWSYPLGPLLVSLAVGDLGGDGLPEIVVGCYAISNGLESNGTDDSHTYIIALDGKGELLWRTGPLGGYFTAVGVSLAQLMGDRRPEIVAALRTAYPSRSDRGALYLLDPRTGAIRHRYEGARGLYAPAVGDVLGNSRLEIVTGGRDGVIRVFDARLRLLRSIVARAPVYVRALADLDLDGKAEIVGTTADRRLVVGDCYPGYPAPTISEFQLNVSTKPEANPGGHVLVSRVLPGPRPQLVTWLGDESRPEHTLRVIEVYAAELPELTTDPTVVTKTGRQAVEFVWNRAGTQLALISGEGEDRRLSVVSVDGVAPRTIATHAGLTAPCWSEDGHLCALRTGSQHVDRELGELLIFDARESGSPRTVKGAAFGPPVWDRKSKRWLCAAKDQRGWSVCAITADASVALLAGPWPLPLGERIACLSDRQQVIVSQSTVHRVPKPNPEGAVFDRTQLYCLDLGSSKSLSLANAANLREALTSGAQGFESDAVAEWLSELQDLLPGVSAADKDGQGRAIPRPVPVAVSPNDDSVAFPLTLARYFRPELGKTAGGWVGNSPHDLWIWSAATHQLQRLTTDDDAFETNPTWSPDGRWLAYEVQRQDLNSPTQEIWISVPGRPGGSKLCDGHSPQWRPGRADRHELALLRDGEVWLARVHEPPATKAPLYESAVLPYAMGGTAGLALTVLALSLRLHDRLRTVLRTARIAVQAVTRSRAEVLLRELVSIVDAAESALHSLKNTVMLLPPLSDDTDEVEESLGYVLTEENVSAVNNLTEMALQAVRRLADIRGEVDAALAALPPAVAESYGRAAQALLRERSGLEARAHQLQQLTTRFAQRGKMQDSDRRAFVQHAHTEVGSYYRWLVDEESSSGLFDVVRHASAPLLVGAVVNEAAASVAGRATELGVSVTIQGAQSRIRVPGDPTPLTQVLVDLLGNALDAIAERAKAEPEAYRGAISVSVVGADGLTTITLTDNGCGVAPAVLDRLRRGESLSTKGKDRGIGLSAARRTLSRYPLGTLALASVGPGKGCTVTVCFEEL